METGQNINVDRDVEKTFFFLFFWGPNQQDIYVASHNRERRTRAAVFNDTSVFRLYEKTVKNGPAGQQKDARIYIIYTKKLFFSKYFKKKEMDENVLPIKPDVSCEGLPLE